MLKKNILDLDFIYEEEFLSSMNRLATPEGCSGIDCDECQIRRIRIEFDIGCDMIMRALNKPNGEYGRRDESIRTGVYEMAKFFISNAEENGGFWKI